MLLEVFDTGNYRLSIYAVPPSAAAGAIFLLGLIVVLRERGKRSPQRVDFHRDLAAGSDRRERLIR
jgi:hypothetical protein